MSTNLKILAILFCLFMIGLVIYFIRENKIIVKYSFIWFSAFMILLLFALFPGLLNFVTKMIGMQVGSNVIFSLVIALLIFITLSLTIIVSSQTKKIRLLIQEVSMLKEEMAKK